MIIEEMAQLLETAGIGALGSDMFLYQMPKEIETGILILPRQYGDTYDRDIDGLMRGGFQVIVRTQSYDDTVAQNIIKTLSVQGKILNGLDVKYILPKSEPFAYPATDGKNVEYSVNFDAVYAKT